MDGSTMGRRIDAARRRLDLIDKKLATDSVLETARKFLQTNKTRPLMPKKKTASPVNTEVWADKFGNITRRGNWIRPGKWEGERRIE